MTTDESNIKNHAAFIWSVADLLRGEFKQSDYGKVILPLTVLRRLDAVLAPVKDKMLEKYAGLEGRVGNYMQQLVRAAPPDELSRMTRPRTREPAGGE